MDEPDLSSRPSLRLSTPEVATPEELERRRRLVEATLALRRRIGPVGLSLGELIAEARQEGRGA